MATSSSDESSTAPKDFHLSSSLDSGSRLSPNSQKCQLCSKFQKRFHCKDCVRSGNFCHSKSPTERYADKENHWLSTKDKARATEERCLELIKKNRKVDVFLACETRQSKERVRLLKLALDEKKKQQAYNAKRLNDLNSRNANLAKNLPRYAVEVEKVDVYICNKREQIQELKRKLLCAQEELKTIARIRVDQLIKYIFPITIVEPKSEIDSSSEMDMVSALAEASHTTYIKDRWVYTDNSGELQYSIVAPCLSGSGNYSAYNVWVTQNKDAVPGASTSTAIERNPAYSISAALTYTAQLVNILSFYLDVQLPYKMLYSEFCSNDMNEQQFSRKVAKLNANVLQLCYSQNTDVQSLHAFRTLHNILQLVDSKVTGLGRQGPLEVDAQQAQNLEEQLANDLQNFEDSDSEEGDALPYEWEAVPHVQCLEPGPVNPIHSVQMTSTQQATSMVGGVVTSAAASIASIWRGWTGR